MYAIESWHPFQPNGAFHELTLNMMTLAKIVSVVNMT
jgi:hypothetical protein